MIDFVGKPQFSNIVLCVAMETMHFTKPFLFFDIFSHLVDPGKQPGIH